MSDTRNASKKWFIGYIKERSDSFSDKYTINLAERIDLLIIETHKQKYLVRSIQQNLKNSLLFELRR
jgi:hypothetical protein